MSDMLTALIAAGALPETTYGANSRYYGLPVIDFEAPDGSVIRYVARRFIPRVELFPSLTTHRVQQGDRIDVLAARYLGDPLLYWRIADANLAIRPDDPVVLGASLNIPLPPVSPGGLT